MKNKKIIIIVCLALVILLAIGVSIYILTNKPEENKFKIDGIDVAENKDILKDTTVENLEITNISLLIRDGISTYSAQINNPTENDIAIDKLYVTFYEDDKENKLLALSNASIKTKGKAYINVTSESDLSKTTKITYSIENNSTNEE